MFLPPITTLSSIYISVSLILISDLLLPFQLLMSTHQPLFEQTHKVITLFDRDKQLLVLLKKF